MKSDARASGYRVMRNTEREEMRGIYFLVFYLELLNNNGHGKCYFLTHIVVEIP